MLQYQGFEAKSLVRLYKFIVRESEKEPREFTFTIANEAFDSHRARYQDAPDICSLKLRRELAAGADEPPKNHFRITDAELDDYRNAHSPKSQQGARKPRESA
jgi:hypothetical protein